MKFCNSKRKCSVSVAVVRGRKPRRERTGIHFIIVNTHPTGYNIMSSTTNIQLEIYLTVQRYIYCCWTKYCNRRKHISTGLLRIPLRTLYPFERNAMLFFSLQSPVSTLHPRPSRVLRNAHEFFKRYTQHFLLKFT